jgi:hypothetical protein
MKSLLKHSRFFLLIFVLLLVFGCSYDRSYTQSQPSSKPDCAKFYSDWTEADRVFCMGGK